MKIFWLSLTFFLAIFSFGLYSYLSLQNEWTELQMALPLKERQIRLLEEEARRLAYEVERFEAPSHLIEVASRPEFRHLRHPLLQEVLSVSESLAANEP